MDPQANPFAAFSMIVAPAILTNAASVLAMSTSNRLARAVDRARDLARQLEAHDVSPAASGPDRAEYERRLEELSATETRTTMLLHVLQSFYFALGGFASSTLAALLGAVLAPWGPAACDDAVRDPGGRRGNDRRRVARARVRCSWCARRALPCASSASARQAFARVPGYNNRDDLRPCLTRSAAWRAQRRRDLPGDSTWRARHAHRRPRERRGRGQPGPRADRVPRDRHLPVDRGPGRASARRRAAGSPGLARAGRRRHPLRPAAGRRVDRPPRRSSASSSAGRSATPTWSA